MTIEESWEPRFGTCPSCGRLMSVGIYGSICLSCSYVEWDLGELDITSRYGKGEGNGEKK
jgi:hypothetical protein